MWVKALAKRFEVWEVENTSNQPKWNGYSRLKFKFQLQWKWQEQRTWAVDVGQFVFREEP